MIDASEGLEKTVAKLVAKGVKGVLVSGGFRESMELPIEKFVSDLAKCRVLLKAVSIHLGLHRVPSFIQLVSRYVDVIDFEFVASRKDCVALRGLEPKNYLEILELLVDLGVEVVPHVFLWTPWRTLSDLLSELSIIESLGIRRATLLVLMGFGEPPKTVCDWLSRAATHFSGELYLGCMRPSSVRKWLDLFALREGLVERIATPHPKAMDYCDALYDACCSLPLNLLSYFEAKAYFSWGQS